jgi:hypothetical protein
VVTAEREWIIRSDTSALTSGSLRDEIRRGMLVMPAEMKLIIQRDSAAPASRSLRGGMLGGVAPRSKDLPPNKTHTELWN